MTDRSRTRVPHRPCRSGRGPRVAMLAAALAASTGLAGCTEAATPGAAAPPSTSTPTPTPTTQSVDTVFGQVAAPIRPQRVVTLGSVAGPVLSAGVKPVAVTDAVNNLLPEEEAQLRGVTELKVGKESTVGDGIPHLDLKAVRAARPDLIIGALYLDGAGPSATEKAAYEQLSAIAPTVIVRSERVVRSAWDDMVRIAEIAGDGTKAKAAKAAYERKAAQIKAAHAQVLAREVFAPVGVAAGKVIVDGPGGLTGAVVADCGGILPAATRERPDGDMITPAQVPGVLGGTTVLLYALFNDGTLRDPELKKMPQIQSLPSVRKDQAASLAYFDPGRYEVAVKTAEDFEKLLQRIESIRHITPAPSPGSATSTPNPSRSSTTPSPAPTGTGSV